jgi:RNA polymerase sigma-54 factor
MNRQAKEALLYAKEKVKRHKGFIDAVRQRRHTLYLTMKAIIEWQHLFFTDGG